MWSCLCSVIVLWSVGWWWKERRRWNPVPAHSLLFSKSTKEAVTLNVPIRRANRYQQFYMLFHHRVYTAEGFGILSRPVMYNIAIRKCTSPVLLAPRLKIFKWKFTTPPGIEPRTRWTRGRHATIWASVASKYIKVNSSKIPTCWVPLFRTVNACITLWEFWIEVWEKGLILSLY